jgi:hypothetical protein
VSETPEQLRDSFVIKAGKRGSLTMWVFVLTAAWIGFVLSLISAIAARTVTDAGGVGHVFIPMSGVAFTALGLCVVVARWWEDETEFRVVDDCLEVRHGVGPFHWPAVRMDASRPVVFTGDNARGTIRVFVEQDAKRVLLGNAEAIVPLQYSHWVGWMRHHGITVEQHWDVATR